MKSSPPYKGHAVDGCERVRGPLGPGFGSMSPWEAEHLPLPPLWKLVGGSPLSVPESEALGEGLSGVPQVLYKSLSSYWQSVS